MVEVADELWVYGTTELGHLSVCGSDEDPLHSFHHDVVEQGVLSTRCQSDTRENLGVRADDLITNALVKKMSLFVNFAK